MGTQRDVTVLLNVAAKPGAASQLWRDISKDLKNQEYKIAQMQLGSASSILAQKVGLDLAGARAQKQYGALYRAESNRQQFGGFGELLTGLQAAVPYAAAVAAGVGAITGVMKGAIELAKVANPFAAERNALAWNDLYAVVGQRFTPLLETTTSGVRLLADTLNSILPPTNDIRMAFGEVNHTMVDLRDTIAGVVYIGKELDKLNPEAALAKSVGIPDGAIKKGLQFAQSPVQTLLTEAAKMFGKQNPLASSFGASNFRSPSFTGIAGSQMGIYAESLRAGAVDDAQKRGADASEGILAKLTDQIPILNDIVKEIRRLQGREVGKPPRQATGGR